MTTPRTADDYAECKRKFNEEWLARGKGRPTAPAGPRIDMGDEDQLPRCCCLYWFGGFVAVTTLLIMAAGLPPRTASCGETTSPPAASPSLSHAPLFGWERDTQPAPFTLALTSAVAHTNAALKGAAGSACISRKQAGADHARLLYIRQYIAQFPDVDAEQVANLLVDAGTANGVDPLLLMCLARYESTFNVADIGAAGERGLLQVHPCHRRAMKRLGLDFYAEADRLAYACRMYNAQGLRPWTVRRRALALYESLKGEM